MTTDQSIKVHQAHSGRVFASLVVGELHLQVGKPPNAQTLHVSQQDGRDIQVVLAAVLDAAEKQG